MIASRKYLHWACFSLLLILEACVQPFEPDNFQFERIIVVDGLLTDETKKHYVQLNYTYPIGTEAKAGITNAIVWVEDDQGNRYDYTEGVDGLYEAVNEFQGVAGREYQLFFQTDDGIDFESTPAELIKSPPIDSIYDRFARIPIEDEQRSVPGIQFFVDSHDDSGDSKFYRYEWEDTYKISTPFISQVDYDRALRRPFTRINMVNICYDGDSSANLILATSNETVEKRVSEVPVRFVSGWTDILRTRYSLLVRQYAVSADAYNYYVRFKKINESGGSLFDIQQGSVLGNIKASNDPKLNVLGYFEVAGVVEKRQFWSLNDLDPMLQKPRFRFYCGFDRIVNTSIDSAQMELDARDYYQILSTDIDRVNLIYKGCTDCTWYSSKEKPDFWVD